MNQEQSPVILRAVLKEREELVRQRNALTADLDAQIAQLDAFLGGATPHREGMIHSTNQFFPPTVNLRPSITKLILEAAKELVLPGLFVTTTQIYETMLARGAVFPQDGKTPHQRITKALSATGLYKGSKSRGWSLKGEEPPAGTPVVSSGATKSDEDEL